MGVADSGVRNSAVHDQGTYDAAKVWRDVLEQLRLRVPREGYETWLAPTCGRAFGSDSVEIEVPNSFSADWIGQHYSTDIRAALTNVTGRQLGVVFRPADVAGNTVVISRRDHARRRPTIKADGYRFQERYTFDTFVVGEHNRLAAAAARSVAERPGTGYNPLLVYGGVGLGKTHLIQAIGNQALGRAPQMRVHYCAAETLFIELIQAIEKNTRLEFKNKYRGLDLLLLDDIHYLIGKERLQEEVFYIFNSLHDAGSQIVFTSDRPPQDIPTLESRLASRLGSGLVVDIQPPDLETRVAILKHKALADAFPLPDNIAHFVATRVRSSVRELEGCLIRLMAMTSLAGRPLTVDMAQEALKDLLREEQPLDSKQILASCSQTFGVPVPDITGTRRTKQLALARQVAMYLIRTQLSLSLKEIGYLFGGKDHTTVLHALRTIETKRAKDPILAAQVDRLIKTITRAQPR